MDPKTFRKSIKISEKRNIEKIQFSRALDGYEGARVTSQEQLLWLRGVNDIYGSEAIQGPGNCTFRMLGIFVWFVACFLYSGFIVFFCYVIFWFLCLTGRL